MPSGFTPDAIWVSDLNVRKVDSDPGSTVAIRNTTSGLGRVKAELDALIDQVSQISGHIETAANKTYILDLKAPYGYTVNALAAKTVSGTCTAKLTIDGVDVTGISALSVTSTEASATASAANVVGVDTTLALVVSANSAALDLLVHGQDHEMSRRWLFWPAPAAGGGEQTVTVSIAASEDDAAQAVSNGAMTLNSTTLAIQPAFTAGVRFLNLTIPKNATVVDAFIQFTAGSNNQMIAVTASIFGQAADNAGTFTSTTSDISSRTKTTASVSWVMPSFVTIGDRLAAQKTPDLKTVVQEIVDRAGWASGNAMVVILANASGAGPRHLATWDHATLAEATLTVRYTPPWILATGAWNDTGVWTDAGAWNDGS